ncbi:MAG: rhomboid family intramembrane serine protease [Chitinophagales bacterium]|jgi:membrane associated rhomboid family serine protease|nr:rhomboid family intramembrane serine protease [Chitinophagales bacterium]
MSATILIIIATCLVSFPAFNNENLFNQLAFWPEKIWHDKEYHRMLTGGLLHADMPHLFFNMFSLYFFGPYIEVYFNHYFGGGTYFFIAFYFAAVFIAHLPDLFLHKDNYYYRGVGASGAVSAVIFASILFDPTNILYIQFIIPVPALLFGVGYLSYSVYMSKRGGDNIAHLAHFAGAVFGFVFPLVLQPSLIQTFFSKITHFI